MGNRLIRIQKISWKLTWIYSLLFSAVLLVLSAGVLYGVRSYLLEQAYSNIRSSSTQTSTMILDTKNGPVDLTDNALMSEAQTDSDINIIVADPRGIIVNQAQNYSIENNSVLVKPGVIRRVTSAGQHLMLFNIRVADRDGKTVAYLQTAYNLEKSYHFIKILFVTLAIADALGILASVLVGAFVSRRMLKPIDKMTKTAQNISISDLGMRIPVGDADDELTRLAVTFNDMLDRLKGSIDRQIRFVSDASHELRTPISVISGYINLLDRWGKDDKKVLEESVDAIKKETAGMKDLIEKLLYLARSDSGKMPFRRESFNLMDMLQDVAEETRMLAPQMSVTVNMAEPLHLCADLKMVKQLFRIVIDNSIKFAGPAGTITLHAATSDEFIRIAIEDNGVGVPKEEVSHIFDRFYRVDKTRSKETGGSGLGLSIAKSIVEAHDGDIYMDSAPGAGTTVTIILPQGNPA